MSFQANLLAQIGASLTNREIPTLYSYEHSDTMSAMKTSGYFNDLVNQVKKADMIFLIASDGHDLLTFNNTTGTLPVVVATFITAGDLSSDAVETTHIKDLNVTTAKIAALAVTDAELAANSVITAKILDDNVTAGKIGPDAVTTVKILDANVTLAKLAAGITPSHVVKFGDDAFTTVGGAAGEAITVAGVVATDIVHVTLRAVGAAPVTILTAIPSADTITVTFSADPSNDHIVTYSVLRAAA